MIDWSRSGTSDTTGGATAAEGQSSSAAEALRAAADSGPLQGILDYTDEPLVSIDLNGSLSAAWKQMTAKGVKRIQSADIQTA